MACRIGFVLEKTSTGCDDPEYGRFFDFASRCGREASLRMTILGWVERKADPLRG